MIRRRFLLFLVVLLSASLACSLFSGVGNSTGVEGSQPSTGGDSPETGETPDSPSDSETFDTEFPLPSNVESFTELGNDSINYQTSMKLPEVVDFYRQAFMAAGYEERDILTVIEDATFSIVWDGHPSGQAIVVQGVDLGNGTTNVNVRFEDV